MMISFRGPVCRPVAGARTCGKATGTAFMGSQGTGNPQNLSSDNSGVPKPSIGSNLTGLLLYFRGFNFLMRKKEDESN